MKAESSVIHIQIYGRPDCHLCEVAKKKILNFAREFPIHVEEVDISQNEELLAAYWERIPLVFVNGRLAAKYRIEDKDFRKILKKAKRG